jgi:predicted SPOUT superfamily RNA methylase MTH1
MKTLPIVVMAVLFGIAVPGFTQKARLQAGEPDQRVEKALKKLGLKYKVDKEGDFLLVFATEGGRNQVVIINSRTETLRKMELREIWSPAAQFSSTPPSALSQALLEKNASFKVGSYAYKKAGEGDAYYLVFHAQISADASAEELLSVVIGVAGAADATESDIMQTDDF